MIIKHKSANLKKVTDVKSVIGKKVLSKNGATVGSIKNVFIHPDKKTIEAIHVGRGVFKNDDYIGKNYIKSITHRGAILNIDPLKEIIGMKVLDAHGKKVGKVKSFTRSKKTNSMINITVKRGIGKKNIVVPKRQVKDIGKNVMLRTRVKD